MCNECTPYYGYGHYPPNFRDNTGGHPFPDVIIARPNTQPSQLITIPVTEFLEQIRAVVRDVVKEFLSEAKNSYEEAPKRKKPAGRKTPRRSGAVKKTLR